MRWWPAYVGIGSNLQQPERQVSDAIELLRGLSDAILVKNSGLYRSAPLCGREQPDYINAVAAMLTQANAREFLQQLHALEAGQGRVRSGKQWDSRVLDLDLLAFGNQVAADADLYLPHPGVTERNFVLLPWNEITPHFFVPGLGSVRDLAARFGGHGPAIERLD
jgi:2-amino-4-hydroxy-6-hydroxymethyldihydropteridine diphosphokinase